MLNLLCKWLSSYKPTYEEFSDAVMHGKEILSEEETFYDCTSEIEYEPAVAQTHNAGTQTVEKKYKKVAGMPAVTETYNAVTQTSTAEYKAANLQYPSLSECSLPRRIVRVRKRAAALIEQRLEDCNRKRRPKMRLRKHAMKVPKRRM